jgi:hypothetical protein
MEWNGTEQELKPLLPGGTLERHASRSKPNCLVLSVLSRLYHHQRRDCLFLGYSPWTEKYILFFFYYEKKKKKKKVSGGAYSYKLFIT